jgi:hypothetical protein
MRDPNAQTLTNHSLVKEMRQRENNKMNHPISIIIYPLFGGWRAECRECGAYGNSSSTRFKSNIQVALDNLAKNEHSYSEASKTCNHYYGNYKPRVTCHIDYNNLQFIQEPFTKDGDATFPSIILDNKFHISVFNAKHLTHEWSAYSYNKYVQQDLKEEELTYEAQDIPSNKKTTISHRTYTNLTSLSMLCTTLILGALIIGNALNCSRYLYIVLFTLQIINVLFRGGLEYAYKKSNL